ncbi:MAG: hypothetical protein MUO77_06735 [Anaerolineales bacterium]|nr:hypothetical protein [Anaerolineales bacterium]
MTIVGLPDTAVQESRERVQTAVKNAGLHFLPVIASLSTLRLLPSAKKARRMTCPSRLA